MDSFIDKILVLSLFFAFFQFTFWKINILFIIVILIREITLTLMRVWAGVVNYTLKTEYHGKIKTVLQIISQIVLWLLLITYFLLIKSGEQISHYWNFIFKFLPNSLLFLVTIFSVYSGITYLLQNKKLFLQKKK